MSEVQHVLIVEALGLHHYVAHLADALSKHCRVDVEVLGYSRRFIRNIPFYFILPRSFCDNRSVQSLLLMFMSFFYIPLMLWHLLRRQNYDILHIQGRIPWLFLLFPYINKKKSALVMTVHDPVYRSSHTGIKGLVEWLYVRLSCLPRLSMKRANSVIVHGKKLCRLLEESGVESQKITVLPHGNFSSLRGTAKSGAEKCPQNYVLFFGKMKPYKGIETIIRAVPIVKKEIGNVLVVVAGSGDIKRYLSLVNRNDRTNFSFLNYYVPDEDIPFLFQNAAVVVLPYTSASQSGVLSLAYTFGKPVIVSRVGSIDEYVDNEITGFIFEPNDHRALAKIIVKILRDRRLRKAMELNCYDKAFSDMSWEKIAEDTLEIYKRARGLL